MIFNIIDNICYYTLFHNKVTVRFDNWVIKDESIYLYMEHVFIARYDISEKTFNKYILESKRYYINNAIYNQDTKKLKKFKNIFGEKEFLKLSRKGKK